MKLRVFALCALFAGFAAMAQAQAPGTFTIKCNTALVDYQFSSNQDIWTYTCTTDATINGVSFKGMTYSATGVVSAGKKAIWGVIVGTLANGDLVYFEYQQSALQGGGASVSTSSYKIVGGTGAANGISGSGTCKESQATGQGSEKTCVGAYATR